MAWAWSASSEFAPGGGESSASWRALAIRVLDRLGTWEQRAAQRRRLAELDDRELADIGRGRAEATIESAKPFWRA